MIITLDDEREVRSDGAKISVTASMEVAFVKLDKRHKLPSTDSRGARSVGG
ncbi:MAG: hypothetical protein AABZ06_01120 [Bdellovibrionota bacterium]